MFRGVDHDICQIAWQTIMPAVVEAARTQITNKLDGTIIVIDPTKSHTYYDPSFKDVLFEASVISTPDPKYRMVAMDKAIVTARLRMPSCRVQQEFPYYKKGDVKWGGATIDAGGLIVAFSGVQ